MHRDLSTPLQLQAHPRLAVPASRWRSLKKPPQLPLLRKAARFVQSKAEEFVRSPELRYSRGSHNSLLLRAREMQNRIWTLLVHWGQSGDPQFRQATLDHVRQMHGWEYWGWDLERQGIRDPAADFDLSYGENSTTLAFAYDWLFATLSPDEKKLFHDAARHWVFGPFLKIVAADHTNHRPGWWFERADTNWNTVCAGGAGLLALSLLDEIAEASQVLEKAEISIAPYLKYLEQTGGAWPEGIGYWNYGHRYAFLYLLSHERATGKEHPLMKLKGVRDTLEFPTAFCPNGQGCSFGDVNVWGPLAFHYAVAQRLRRPALTGLLDSYLAADFSYADISWPNAAELLLVHPGRKSKSVAVEKNVARLYPKLDWGILADRLPAPNLYLSVRGGTTKVPHSHLDLGSYQCVVGKERLIDNIGIEEYLDTTFSSRRGELFEFQPVSKNVLLINGVGIANPATATSTTVLTGRGWQAIRLDLAEAFGSARGGTPMARFYVRLFLRVNGAILIVDRVQLAFPGRLETRSYSFSKIEMQESAALIRGKQETLALAFAASAPCRLHYAEPALTTPSRGCSCLRWCTENRDITEITLVTLLMPGKASASVKIESDAQGIVLRAGRRKSPFTITLDHKLTKVHCK